MSIQKPLSRPMSRRAFLATLVGASGAALTTLVGCQGPGGPSGEAARPVAPTQKLVPTAVPSVAYLAPGSGGAYSGKTVAIQVWGGGFAGVIRDLVQPAFERDNDVLLTVSEASSADQLARLRAERDWPRHIMMGLEDSAVSAARAEGLVARLEPRDIPNLHDVYQQYYCDNGYGVGQAVSWVTVWYNSERIKTPPDSYESFWNPKYRGRVAVPALTTTAGLQWLAVASAVGLGKTPQEAQYQPEAGFEMWKQLKPNLHSTFEAFGSVVPLLAQGEIWLAFGPSRMANTFIVKGAPVERAEVKEGSFLGNQAMVLVNHPKLQPLGRDLINRLLAPEVQTEFSRVVGTGPTNRRTEVPSELTSLVPLGEVEAQRLIRLDWSYAAQQHAGWLDRWHKEISG